jgi:hypothetical protein
MGDGGKVAIAYGLLVNGNQTASGSNSIVGQVRALNPKGIPGAISNTIGELRQGYGTLTYKEVAGGAGLVAADYGIRKIRALRPVKRFLRSKLRINLDKRTAVAVA